MTEVLIESYRRWVDLETRGEASCRMHARCTDDAEQRSKWLLLAELESITKEALVHDLRANGIVIEENLEKRREGELRAEQSAGLAWLDLMAQLRPHILFYVDEVRAIAATALAEERLLALRLCEHEEVWLTFIDRELAGDSKSSMEPILGHLRKWRGRDGEQVGDRR